MNDQLTKLEQRIWMLEKDVEELKNSMWRTDGLLSPIQIMGTSSHTSIYPSPLPIVADGIDGGQNVTTKGAGPA